MGASLKPPGPNAVHLCIDMQNLFAPGGPWATPWMERALPSIASLVSHCPGRTLFTRFIPPRSPADATGVWREYYKKWENVTRENLDPRCLELVPQLARFVPPAPVFDRMVYSAFGGGSLLNFLGSRHVDSLIISGGETDVCVLSTVLSAIDLGYRIILVEDALCSSSDESHDAAIDLCTKRFDIQVGVARLEEILALWKLESA
jgi:nicotinamidase-related amidase